MKNRLLFSDIDIRMRGAVSLVTSGDAAYEFELFADAYHKTAKVAVEMLLNEEGFTRVGWGSVAFRVFPILLLYRQALELPLKGTVVAGSSLVT